jgi:hypothetical protein
MPVGILFPRLHGAFTYKMNNRLKNAQCPNSRINFDAFLYDNDAGT